MLTFYLSMKVTSQLLQNMVTCLEKPFYIGEMSVLESRFFRRKTMYNYVTFFSQFSPNPPSPALSYSDWRLQHPFVISPYHSTPPHPIPTTLLLLWLTIVICCFAFILFVIWSQARSPLLTETNPVGSFAFQGGTYEVITIKVCGFDAWYTTSYFFVSFVTVHEAAPANVRRRLPFLRFYHMAHFNRFDIALFSPSK